MNSCVGQRRQHEIGGGIGFSTSLRKSAGSSATRHAADQVPPIPWRSQPGSASPAIQRQPSRTRFGSICDQAPPPQGLPSAFASSSCTRQRRHANAVRITSTNCNAFSAFLHPDHIVEQQVLAVMAGVRR